MSFPGKMKIGDTVTREALLCHYCNDEPGRAVGLLETITRYSFEQGLIPRQIRLEEVFLRSLFRATEVGS